MKSVLQKAGFQDPQKGGTITPTKAKDKADFVLSGLIHDIKLMEREFNIDPWVVDKLIPRKKITTIFGRGGSYKTYFALSMALAVSRGKPWLDKKTEKMTVLYIDEENGLNLIKNRVQQLKDGLGNREMKANIYYTSMQQFNFNNDKDYKALEEFVEANQPCLIVVDSIMRTVSISENKAEDVSDLFAERLSPLVSDFDTSLLLLQHSRKSTQTNGSNEDDGYKQDMLRGSGDWINIPRSAILLEKPRPESMQVVLTHVKSSMGITEKPRRIHIHCESETGAFSLELGAEIKGKETKESQAKELIIEFFIDNKNKDTQAKDLISEVVTDTIKTRTVESAIAKLLESGQIMQPKPGVYKRV